MGVKKQQHQSVTNGFNNVMSDVMGVFRLLQQRFLSNISKGLLFSQTKKVQPNLSFTWKVVPLLVARRQHALTNYLWCVLPLSSSEGGKKKSDFYDCWGHYLKLSWGHKSLFLKCVAEQATCPKVDSGKILLKVLTPVWKIFEEGWYLRKLAWQSVSYLGHCQAAFLKKWRHKMAAS